LPATVHICEDPGDLAQHAAGHIAAAAAAAVAEHGAFTVAVSGGDTPGPTYALLGSDYAESVPWEAVHVFWADERCIALDRPDNHFTLATELMLSRVPIPAGNVHRARGEASDPAAAAVEYEDALRSFFAPPLGEPPAFDLILLGMGEDGHVASLFSGSAGLRERERWVVDHYVIKRGERVRRLTFTMPVLTAAREVMVLVSGDLKADMLAAVLRGETDVPARELNEHAPVVRWMVDQEAASILDPGALSGTGVLMRAGEPR
jgi:6-phosphogluconolactonase